MTTTTQDAFHPFRGHVADGATVKMNNGDVLTIKSVINGWQLLDQHGRRHSIPTKSAHVVACLVYNYPSEEL